MPFFDASLLYIFNFSRRLMRSYFMSAKYICSLLYLSILPFSVAITNLFSQNSRGLSPFFGLFDNFVIVRHFDVYYLFGIRNLYEIYLWMECNDFDIQVIAYLANNWFQHSALWSPVQLIIFWFSIMCNIAVFAVKHWTYIYTIYFWTDLRSFTSTEIFVFP